MLSFLVLRLFCFISFAFTKAAALCSIGRYVCAPTATHSYLMTVSVLFFFFLPFFSLGIYVAFSEYFCTITVFSLCREHVVRFSLSNGVFPPCEKMAGYLTPAYVRIQSIRSINIHVCVCMYVYGCMITQHIARVWISRVRLPILHVVS